METFSTHYSHIVHVRYKDINIKHLLNKKKRHEGKCRQTKKHGTSGYRDDMVLLRLLFKKCWKTYVAHMHRMYGM